MRGVYFSPDFSMTRRDAIVLRPVSRGVHFADAMKLRPYVWSYPTFGDILQHPWLAATPPIFYVRKTHWEKRLPCTWFLSRGKNTCEARVEGCDISSHVGTQFYCVRIPDKRIIY